jgi:hypothetical protein
MWQMVRGCWGNVPKYPKFWDVGASRNATQVMGRNYHRIVESGESGEGERLGAHVAIAISARLSYTKSIRLPICFFAPFVFRE